MANVLSVPFDRYQADTEAFAVLKGALAQITDMGHVRGPLRRCADALLGIEQRVAETAGRDVVGFLDSRIPKIVNCLVTDRHAKWNGLSKDVKRASRRVSDVFDDEPSGVEVTSYEGGGQLARPELLDWAASVDLLEEFCPPDVLWNIRSDPANTKRLIQDLTNHLRARLLRLTREREAAATIEVVATLPSSQDLPHVRTRLPRTITSMAGANRVEAFLSNPTRTETITEFTGRATCGARTLLTLRKTGKASRDVWQGVAKAMRIPLAELLNPEPESGKTPET